MSFREEEIVGELANSRFKYGEKRFHPERRHFWGVPKKNIGFLTSEQLEQVANLATRIKTQGDEQQTVRKTRYHSIKQDKFIYKGTDQIHCCTCHNNPRRYMQGQARCSFCSSFKTKKQSNRGYSQFNRSQFDDHQFNTNTNPEQSLKLSNSGYFGQSDTKGREEHELIDKGIQVELKLPKIKHNSRKMENCTGCRIKYSLSRQSTHKNNRIRTQIEEENSRKCGKLQYSFGTPQKKVRVCKKVRFLS